MKEKVAEAAHVGIEKTQEVYNEYVAPTAAAGKESRTNIVLQSSIECLGAEVVKVGIFDFGR